MKKINNLTPVNGGIVKRVRGEEIEILSHNFHNPNCDIVCTYFRDKKGNKTELTYYKDITTGKEGHELYKFNNDDLQHYYSRHYKIKDLPKKHQGKCKNLIKIHHEIDFNQHLIRFRQ